LVTTTEHKSEGGKKNKACIMGEGERGRPLSANFSHTDGTLLVATRDPVPLKGKRGKSVDQRARNSWARKFAEKRDRGRGNKRQCCTREKKGAKVNASPAKRRRKNKKRQANRATGPQWGRLPVTLAAEKKERGRGPQGYSGGGKQTSNKTQCTGFDAFKKKNKRRKAPMP